MAPDSHDDGEPSGELRSRGQIVFDDLTDPEFEHLVERTLEESIWIEVKNDIIYEVMDE